MSERAGSSTLTPGASGRGHSQERERESGRAIFVKE